MNELPVSVRMALSWRFVASGSSAALDAVGGPDVQHLVRTGADATDLVRWARSRAWAASTTLAVLPVPGDVNGVPPAAAGTAVEAGEAVLLHADAGLTTLVPRRQGTDVVEWHAWSAPGPPPTWLTLPAARRGLLAAMSGAAETLAQLDVARWAPEAAATLAELRSPVEPRLGLPIEPSPDRVDLLVRAWRLLRIARLALADEGASVTRHQADSRTLALRALVPPARAAITAATAPPG